MMSILGEIKTKWGTAKLDKAGYYVITTRKEGYHHKRLHHLIWSEHYGKPVPKGYIIHHLNMNKTDNRIQNRTDLRKLEDEVKSKGLKWVEL